MSDSVSKLGLPHLEEKIDRLAWAAPSERGCSCPGSIGSNWQMEKLRLYEDGVVRCIVCGGRPW
jgi:hypothetical protein